jgi:hypothetical protein
MMGAQGAAMVIAYAIVRGRVREGETQRLSSSVRVAHAGRTRVRRVAHGVTQGVLAPVRSLHTARREARQEISGPRAAA